MTGKHLAIQISAKAARFVVFKNEIVLHESSVNFVTTEEEDQKQFVEDHFKASSSLQEDFDEVTLAWADKRSTLVPNNIFAESSPKSIFELCYGKYERNDDIDYNRISELGIVNVFEIPVWIKRFFVLKFPRIIIQHEGTHALRGVMNVDTFRAKVTAIVHDGYFQLIIVKHNNLEFYSTFDYQNVEDVIYHLVFTLQQKELTGEKGFIDFSLSTEVDNELLEAFKNSIGRIKELKDCEFRSPNNFIAKSQLLCV